MQLGDSCEAPCVLFYQWHGFVYVIVAFKIWDRLEARYGPWRALLLILFAATNIVLVLWLALTLLGVPIVPIIFPRTEDGSLALPPNSPPPGE